MLTLRYSHFDTVTSTNDIALDMARNGEPEGLVITADRQTKGRGRRGHTWWDECGQSVLMSILLTPDIPPTHLSQLSFVVSLSAAECLESKCNLDASLKWPNDVLVNDKKLGGILIETIPAKHIAVAGIGINVNQTAFPPELSTIATSIALENGMCLDTSAISRALAEAIRTNYQAYLANGFEEILDRWRKYMWGLGRLVEVASEEDAITGIIAGIGSDGALLVDQDGELRRIIASVGITGI